MRTKIKTKHSNVSDKSNVEPCMILFQGCEYLGKNCRDL